MTLPNGIRKWIRLGDTVIYYFWENVSILGEQKITFPIPFKTPPEIVASVDSAVTGAFSFGVPRKDGCSAWLNGLGETGNTTLRIQLTGQMDLQEFEK